MTIKITTPNGGSDSLDFGCAQTAIVATVTGTEVSSGEGKLELKTTTGGTSATKMTIAANGTVTFAGGLGDISVTSLNGGQLGGRRNIVINGEMKVAQRSASETGLGGGSAYATLDRYRTAVGAASGGRFTMAQIADGPAGFANCMKITTTTADTSIAAGENLQIVTRFEGQDVQQLQKGTATAKQVTVSFYVKGNATATYTCELQDYDNGRSIQQAFDVTTAWNRIELTFAADTSDPFDDDNAGSLGLAFWLHGGSTYTGGTFSSNAWKDTVDNTRLSDSQTSIFDATSRTFFLTGIQMELGDTATEFEHRSYAEELYLCQRYFRQWGAHANTMLGMGLTYNATNVHRWGIELIPPMRAAPTGAFSGTCGLWNGGGIGTVAVLSTNYTKPDMIQYDLTCNSGIDAGIGKVARVYLNTGTFTATAEL
jgi:hypothetical protein